MPIASFLPNQRQTGAMTIHRAALLLSLLAITGCGALSEAGPPQERGFEDAEIAWEGNASRAAVGLEPKTDTQLIGGVRCT